MSDEKGNVEIDIAVDSKYIDGDWNDPGSDFVYGVLRGNDKGDSRKMRIAFDVIMKNAPWGLAQEGIFFRVG